MAVRSIRAGSYNSTLMPTPFLNRQITAPSGFQGVESIESKEDGILIIGTNGSRIQVPLDLSYIK